MINTRALVESERIELSSKQVTKELSTRLFFSCFFDYKLVKDNLLITYLFSFKSKSKHFTSYVNIYDASKRNAVNQGFPET